MMGQRTMVERVVFTSRNAELLERAEKLSVEVSVLSLREGRSRRL